MNLLTIKLDQKRFPPYMTVAAVVTIYQEYRLVCSFPMTQDTIKKQELSEGRYWVQADFPDGETVNRHITLSQEGITLDLFPELRQATRPGQMAPFPTDEEIEKKAATQFMALARNGAVSEHSDGLSLERKISNYKSGLHISREVVPYRSECWFRCWFCRENGSIHNLPINPDRIISPIGNLQWKSEFKGGEPVLEFKTVSDHYSSGDNDYKHRLFLQIGGPDNPGRIIPLTLPWNMPDSHRGEYGETAPLTVRWRMNGDAPEIQPPDPQLAGLLDFIDNSNLNAARNFGKLGLARLAEDYLLYKKRNPYAAAAGGYFLLRTRQMSALHDWPKNLADWYPFLPDGAIIHAWTLILSSDDHLDEDRWTEAYRYLLLAVRAGVPVYTEGVRLLMEGLELFKNDPLTERDRQKTNQAIEMVSAFASAADPGRSFTTFVGRNPKQPDLHMSFRSEESGSHERFYPFRQDR